jgi:hypothetical protein
LPDNPRSLQQDVDNLRRSEREWLVKFNLKFPNHICHQEKEPVNYNYNIHGHILEEDVEVDTVYLQLKPTNKYTAYN